MSDRPEKNHSRWKCSKECFKLGHTVLIIANFYLWISQHVFTNFADMRSWRNIKPILALKKIIHVQCQKNWKAGSKYISSKVHSLLRKIVFLLHVSFLKNLYNAEELLITDDFSQVKVRLNIISCLRGNKKFFYLKRACKIKVLSYVIICKIHFL